MVRSLSKYSAGPILSPLFCLRRNGTGKTPALYKHKKMVSVLHSNTRHSEKLLDEAQYSGKLILNNRKLKDVVLCSGKHDLTDVTVVDFSRNGLNEVPIDLCEWYCLKNVTLSYNFIKVVPDFLIRLRLVQVLDLSNNLLSHLPSTISELKDLVVLRLNNNNLVSIPVEIGKLKKCQEFDVSGNSLNILPATVGKMDALLHFDVSRNNLADLPHELCQLPLVYFNASENCITKIPLCFQNMESIQQLILDQNPLMNPPAKLLKKGRVHLFKYLQIESAKSSDASESVTNSRDGDLSSHPNLNFLANVVDQLSTSSMDDMTNGSADERRSDSVSSVSSSPRKRACNTNVLQSQISEEKLVSESPTPVKQNGTARKPSIAEKPVSLPQGSPTKRLVSPKGSPKKRVSSPKTSPVKKLDREIKVFKETSENVPRNLNHNRRSSKEAKLNLTSSFPGYTPVLKSTNKGPVLKPDGSRDEAQYLNIIKPRKAYINRRTAQKEDQLTFTMRRRAEKMYEEMEKLEKLRQCIEATLKMPLPQDLLPALTDGVVLCHLANHVKARSIPTIHVPSPAVPKLSMAKCRRNVDNFLDACIKLGVEVSRLPNAADILHERGIARLSDTVNDLLKLSSKNSNAGFASPTVRIAPSSPSRQNQV
uniref:Leucine-rich repeat and calponin homology domain-containing protein 1-like n=1 Tax=Phallusia mammillata TaxID=59560 RepID=A0A6F9DJ35_9ASCI|nr:leucine-rich repeat and calponin homology domain-containing protein 1-like [Phallusia mammillata]